MNEIISALIKRQSTKRYLPKQIADSDINVIMEAAKYAPSAMGAQPWKFVALRNKTLIDELSQGVIEYLIASGVPGISKKAENGRYHIFHDAPTVVITTGRKEAAYSRIDCACAAMNMITAAEMLGLGACIIGSAEGYFGTEDGDAFIARLGVDEGYSGYFCVTLGYKTDYVHKRAERADNTVIIID